VDVTNPQNISMIQSIEIVGVNQHLYGQWLETEKDRWMIIQYMGVLSGSYEDILYYSMENGSEITSENIYRGYRHNGSYEGTYLKSIFPIDPTWCLIADGYSETAKFLLANISIENDEISFGPRLNLFIQDDINFVGGTNVEQFGDVVYATVEYHLRLIDMIGARKIIFFQALDYYISDLIVIAN
jgi:hypothetical protein